MSQRRPYGGSNNRHPLQHNPGNFNGYRQRVFYRTYPQVPVQQFTPRAVVPRIINQMPPRFPLPRQAISPQTRRQQNPVIPFTNTAYFQPINTQAQRGFRPQLKKNPCYPPRYQQQKGRAQHFKFRNTNQHGRVMNVNQQLVEQPPQEKNPSPISFPPLSLDWIPPEFYPRRPPPGYMELFYYDTPNYNYYLVDTWLQAYSTFNESKLKGKINFNYATMENYSDKPLTYYGELATEDGVHRSTSGLANHGTLDPTDHFHRLRVPKSNGYYNITNDKLTTTVNQRPKKTSDKCKEPIRTTLNVVRIDKNAKNYLKPQYIEVLPKMRVENEKGVYTFLCKDNKCDTTTWTLVSFGEFAVHTKTICAVAHQNNELPICHICFSSWQTYLSIIISQIKLREYKEEKKKAIDIKQSNIVNKKARFIIEDISVKPKNEPKMGIDGIPEVSILGMFPDRTPQLSPTSDDKSVTSVERVEFEDNAGSEVPYKIKFELRTDSLLPDKISSSDLRAFKKGDLEV